MLLSYGLNSPKASFVLKFEGAYFQVEFEFHFIPCYQIQMTQPAFQLSERSSDLQELSVY